MGIENFKTPTPEEMAKIQNERTLSDAKLMEKGAGYEVQKDGSIGLELTQDQIKKIEKEHAGESVPDASTYVKLHKRIVLPVGKMPENLRKETGKAWIGNTVFRFVDKDGNLAEVDIDYSEISSIKVNSSWEKNVEQFKTELTEKGFNFEKEGFQSIAYTRLLANVQAHQNEQIENAKALSKNNFDY